MKKVLFTTGIAVLALATVAFAAGTFNNNLTVGSTGADVVALQNALLAGGFHIPAVEAGTAAKGYFGSQTKTAVQAYQTSKGITSSGFVGPLTRAALNGGVATTGNTACPAGFTCTANSVPVAPTCPAGYTCTSNTTGTVTGGQSGITTPGVPGIMTVTAGPISTSVLNVGQQMVPVLAIRVQAQYSDIDVQTVTLDLGNNTSIFNKIFNKIYVTDSTGILTSQPLNSSTVVQSGSDYIIGLAGFHSIVAKGTYKDIIIKADLNSSIDSTYITSNASHYPTAPNGVFSGSTITNGPTAGWGIGLTTQGVRGVDGAGLNLYSIGSIVQALSINASLTDNAQANISLDGSSPQANAVPVSNTSQGTYSNPPLPIFTFAVNAQNDTLHLHNVVVGITAIGNGAPAGAGVTAAYLMRGSTIIQSASVSNGVATFSNIQDGNTDATIPVGTTVPFTVAVDVSGVTSGSLSITASTTASTQIYNSIDSSATLVGSATSNTLIVSGIGPVFTLSGAPTISVSGTNNSGTSNLSTSTVVASFNMNIGAVGTDVFFGTTGSSSAAFLFNVIDNSGAIIYSGYGSSVSAGVSNNGKISNPAVILPTLSATFTNGAPASSFKVTNGTTNPTNIGVVQFQFDGKDTTGANLTASKPYKVTLAGVRYYTAAGGYVTSTFMNGLTNWTTGTINP